LFPGRTIHGKYSVNFRSQRRCSIPKAPQSP
jgi:hypothetical protein